MKLDFSQFHPLDHWPATPRCWAHYGGPIHHLKIAWTHHRKDQILSPFRRVLFCTYGAHHMGLISTGDRYVMMCWDCDFTRAPDNSAKEQKALAEMKEFNAKLDRWRDEN